MAEVDELTAMARRARSMSFRAAVAALILVGMGGVAAATMAAPTQPGTARDSASERDWPAPGTIGGPPSASLDPAADARLVDLGRRLARLQLNGTPLGGGAE